MRARRGGGGGGGARPAAADLPAAVHVLNDDVNVMLPANSGPGVWASSLVAYISSVYAISCFNLEGHHQLTASAFYVVAYVAAHCSNSRAQRLFLFISGLSTNPVGTCNPAVHHDLIIC